MLPNEFGAGFLLVVVAVVVLAASFSATSTSILAKRVLCQTSLCSALLQVVATPPLPAPLLLVRGIRNVSKKMQLKLISFGI